MGARLTPTDDDQRWNDHEGRHDRAEKAAADTALRLETQVTSAAARLEHQVEKTRAALSEQADVHAKNHDREHTAHELIHRVEKDVVTATKVEMDKRLDGMNEFRDQLRDQAGQFARNDSVGEMSIRLEEKIAGVAKAQSVRSDGLAHQLDDIGKRLERMGGEEAGSRITTGKLFAGLGGLAAFMGIVVIIVNLLAR